MASEMILVVDDAPVNLKLADVLLRKEGYSVHTAVEAQQALALVEDLHPDLVLVDTELSGIGGVEMMRRVKQTAATRDITVVALTQDGTQAARDKAREAGCDGCISKPIESFTFAQRVREYLDRRPKITRKETVPELPEEAAFPPGISLTSSEMEGVRRRFLGDAIQQAQSLLGNINSVDRQRAVRTVHEWVDAAAFLEFPAIAKPAREVERLLRAPAVDFTQLHDALDRLVLGLVEQPESAVGPVPEFVTSALSGKSIALIGFASEDADMLYAALGRASARTRRFDSRIPDCDAVRDCAVAIVQVNDDTRDTFLTAWAGQNGGPPLVLAGPRQQILALRREIQARACEFLIDGWQPEEALMRLGFVLGRKPGQTGVSTAAAPQPVAEERSRGAAGEVLIADDDLTVRTLIRSAFQSAGIQCHVAASGDAALEILRVSRPAAAVLDVNMPMMDGYEVLAAARAEGIPTRILLLTARQQQQDVARGFTLGADDYVVKPFNPAELLARVKRLLRN